jgi:hypothetical protein
MIEVAPKKKGVTMGFLEKVSSTAAPKTGGDRKSTTDSTRNPRRPRAMFSDWHLDFADDPTILFQNVPGPLPCDRNPVAEAVESDERLWARHQAWDM